MGHAYMGLDIVNPIKGNSYAHFFSANENSYTGDLVFYENTLVILN